MAKDTDVLKDAEEAFKRASEYENENRLDALEDLRFARLADQWPDKIIQQRKDEGRPCLTINRMPAFIRQVVNDARQNKPQIRVHPVDSGADKETADVFSGLIRNIETTSDADVAYDTATESAVSGGWGYIRVGVDYTHDDSFDLDIKIQRVADPLKVYGDPASEAADSSDWNTAFIVEMMTKDDFSKKYKGAEQVNWEGDGYGQLKAPWFEQNQVMLAEWWTREEVERTIYLMSDGAVYTEEQLKDPELMLVETLGEPVQSRPVKSWKVRQRIMTGAEVLEDNDWYGRYIPIIPVYGDEVWVDGKRYLRSLIRDAKDPQRMFNFWRTNTTELVALAPRTPFIGPVGSFKTDASKWATANTQSHAHIEYDPQGPNPPQRQPFVGPPAGALQEALNAADDMKAIMGIYDASLGARSNETSGKAILARQREGDVSTFHFMDNMARAIRHTGRIVIDLIPKVYGKRQMVRILGEDGTPDMKPLGVPVQVMGPDKQPVMGRDGKPLERVFDLTVGKYDLTVSTGPSFTTRREEAAAQMTEMIRAFPQAAPIMGDLIAKNLDWPGADEIAERLKSMLPPQAQGGLPPEVQKMMAEGQKLIQQLQAENQQLKAAQAADARQAEIDAMKVKIDAFKAETDRMKAVAEINRPSEVPTPAMN